MFFIWLRRLFPPIPFLMIMISCYLAAEFYPLTEVKIAGFFKLYQTGLEIWLSIVVSILTAFGLLGILIAILGVLLLIIESIFDSSNLSGDETIYSGLHRTFWSISWIISILMFLQFIHIPAPVTYWKKFYWDYYVLISTLLKDIWNYLISALFRGITLGVVGLAVVGCILAVWYYRNSIKKAVSRFIKK